jgi:hypothetical protein
MKIASPNGSRASAGQSISRRRAVVLAHRSASKRLHRRPVALRANFTAHGPMQTVRRTVPREWTEKIGGCHRRGDVFKVEPVKWPLRSYSDVVPSLFLIAVPSKRPLRSVKVVALPRVVELPAKLPLRS